MEIKNMTSYIFLNVKSGKSKAIKFKNYKKEKNKPNNKSNWIDKLNKHYESNYIIKK